jgi:predicted GH43/DUF377 family glycosyl hydrolase
MSVRTVMVLMGFVACGGKEPLVDSSDLNARDSASSAPASSDDTADDTSGPTSVSGLQVAFVEPATWDVVDECERTCITAEVTEDGVPVSGVSVDVWVENDCVGADLTTDMVGRVSVCSDVLPVGEWRAVAVASWAEQTVQVEAPLHVLGFGHIDGIERPFAEGLPYIPNFVRAPGNPVLPPGDAGSFDSVGTLLPSVVKTVDGWVMWYAGTHDVDYSVGVASSPDGHSWLRSSAPALPPDGEEGSWKRFATNAPMAVQDGAGWRVYYSGRAGETGEITIGMASGIKADAVSNHPANPVFAWADSEIPWAGHAVAHPAILHHPDGHWEMWYSTGLHKLGYAYSLDGLDWKRLCRNPVFKGSTGGSWEAHQVKAVDVVFHDGWYLMAYTGGVRGSFQIGWAMSRDGLRWQRAEAPIFGPNVIPGTWESTAVTGPALVVDDEVLRMWYGGTGLTGSAIGLATAALPSSFEAAR